MTAPPITAGEYLQVLEAVREAIDIPLAATYGDDQKRTEILHSRAMTAVVMLRSVLDGPSYGGPMSSVAWCREQLARHPAEGYRTWDEAVAARRAAEPEATAILAASIEAGTRVIVTDDDATAAYCGARYRLAGQWQECAEPAGHEPPHGDPAMRAQRDAAVAADADLYRASVAAEQAARVTGRDVLLSALADGSQA